jgi:hypothetical protein
MLNLLVRPSVTVIGDMGSFGKIDALIRWEMEIPGRFEIDLKGFCLYHMQDFKRLSETDKQKLYRHHTRT